MLSGVLNEYLNFYKPRGGLQVLVNVIHSMYDVYGYKLGSLKLKIERYSAGKWTVTIYFLPEFSRKTEFENVYRTIIMDELKMFLGEWIPPEDIKFI